MNEHKQSVNTKDGALDDALREAALLAADAAETLGAGREYYRRIAQTLSTQIGVLGDSPPPPREFRVVFENASYIVTPFIEGPRVGYVYKDVTTGASRRVYMNPSTEGTGIPDIFVYAGAEQLAPEHDSVLCWVPVHVP